LGGLRAEGIFRIAPDVKVVNELRAQLDSGIYELDERIHDAYALASLLKLFFREMPESVIPAAYYNKCIESAEAREKTYDIINQLPLLDRRILAFLFSFLHLFTKNIVTKVTKMSATSLATIWAPNLLRTSSSSFTVVLNNSPHEHLFVLNLICDFDLAKVDLEGYHPIHPMPLPDPPYVD